MGWRSVTNSIWSRATGGARRLVGSTYAEELRAINARRAELRGWSDEGLTRRAKRPHLSRAEVFALTCEAARRTIGLDPFDVQVIGGLVLADGQIAEMQTGEGKTLAATLPACAAALDGQPVHVLAANEYLARRDARWMGPIYRLLGLSVGAVHQAADLAERKAAYTCDVLYGSATEIGFDFLRDQLRRQPEDVVQRPFGLALVDEVDSILIDEARIPLVIAGGEGIPVGMARRADAVARSLRRGVDYIVRHDSVGLIDETKGRLVPLRRWPDGLQAAVEAKEGLPVQTAGRILGSITLQSFIALYPRVCAMTGTAATQAAEFREIYGLEVVVVPTNRPLVRVDRPDIVWATRDEKHEAVIARIREAYAAGRPVLVGTASVAESETLGRRLEQAGIAHRVLNARNEEAEAAVVQQAGRPGAVTISTNMAGRGTDILLGGDPPAERDRVVGLGGLLVIGTNRHENRRVDHQLRGRAGRQGDPGESEFHVSLDDDLFQRFGLDRETDLDHAQRVIEGQHLDIRLNLHRYQRIVELQRRVVHAHRRDVLEGEAESLLQQGMPERCQELTRELGERALLRLERGVTLVAIDEAWSQYLEEVGQTKEDVAWVSLAGVPLHEYQRNVAGMFETFWDRIDVAVLEAFASGSAATITAAVSGSGATWTYQTNDQAFPDAMTRLAGTLRQLLRRRRGR